MACGYSYHIALVDNGKRVKRANLNIDCEYMDGWVKFPKSLLLNHQSSFKRLTASEISELNM